MSTPSFVIERLQAYGAEAVMHGSVWDEANALAEELACGNLQNRFRPFKFPARFSANMRRAASCDFFLLCFCFCFCLTPGS